MLAPPMLFWGSFKSDLILWVMEQGTGTTYLAKASTCWLHQFHCICSISPLT